MASVFIPFIPHTQLSLPRSSSPFRLPVAPGLTVLVFQGNNSPYDHRGKQAWAFDFTVGQTNFVVTAAQGGMVVGADDSSSIQCSGVNTESAPEQKPLQDCWTYANYVLIADDDGTTATLYMHLLTHSLKVSPNMHVNQGNTLGLAGTTGWSTGVHLHFQVENIPQQTLSAGWWWTQSRPVSFANQEVLAQESSGVPQVDETFVVSNSPQQSTVPPTQIPAPVPTPSQPPPPTPIPQPVLTPGTWQGQETSDGGSPYPTQLVIDSVNGNTFTGVYGIAGPGNSAEPIQNGQINGNTIAFTTPTQVPNEVATYKGTISGNTITGTWSYPGGGGTFSVTKEA